MGGAKSSFLIGESPDAMTHRGVRCVSRTGGAIHPLRLIYIGLADSSICTGQSTFDGCCE